MYLKFSITLMTLLLVCSCGPLRPIKTGFLAVKASGWEETYGIETEEELKESSSIPKLTMALEDKNERVRMSAVKHLTRFGGEAQESVPQLKILALTDRNKNIRRASLWAITQIVGTENDDALYVYRTILTDKTRGNRNQRQVLVDMLARVDMLGPKVIGLLKESYQTEPSEYPKKTILEIILRYEMEESEKA